ncbi:hypothetical protein GCM10010360_11290 [Streptomyces nogalater]
MPAPPRARCRRARRGACVGSRGRGVFLAAGTAASGLVFGLRTPHASLGHRQRRGLRWGRVDKG